MTKKLRIAPNLTLPLDAATSTIVVYGGKGMGKTNLATVLVEEFAHAGIRFAVIDPMGVWWGLRHSADGKGPGIKVLILGGIHGALPITPESGALVADLVVDEDDSVVIDISRRADGSMWAISERIRFVRDYVKRIYQRQGEKRRPLNQVIDEAARFAPQIVRQGESDVAACMGAIAVLVEEGRNVGIGTTLVTQRSARLNKDVAELADCMIAFRIVGPNSMRAVLDWLGEHVEKSRLKEIGEKLRSLPRGSALVVSPGWLEFEGIVAMRKRTTFDSSKTPESGGQVRASGEGAKLDLSKYRERLAELVEQQKANDPKVLRARVAELEKQLAKKKESKVKTETVIEKVGPNKVVVAGLERSIKGAEKLLDRTGKRAAQFSEAGALARACCGDLVDASTKLQEKMNELIGVLAATNSPGNRPVRAGETAAAKATPRVPGGHPTLTHRDRQQPTTNGVNGTAIGGGLRRILVALAQRPSGLTNRQLGLRAGLSSKSGTFSTYLSRARQAGWIEDRGETRLITEQGIGALGSFEPLPTGVELQRYWLGELGGGAARILQVLIDAYPAQLDNATIGERASISPGSGTFSTYISRMRGLELITGGRGAPTSASEELFS